MPHPTSSYTHYYCFYNNYYYSASDYLSHICTSYLLEKNTAVIIYNGFACNIHKPITPFSHPLDNHCPKEETIAILP